MKKEIKNPQFITIQGYDTLPTKEADIKDGLPIKIQQPKYNYPDNKVDMITVDKKLLDEKYNSTSTAVYNNQLEGSEKVWQSQQNPK